MKVRDKLLQLVLFVFGSEFVVESVISKSACDTTNKKTIYEYSDYLWDGTKKDLKDYKNHIVMITNLATFSPRVKLNYIGLNALMEEFGSINNTAGDCSLKILGFPCNQVTILSIMLVPRL